MQSLIVLALPTTSSNLSENSSKSDRNKRKKLSLSDDEKVSVEKKLYSPAQFRSHINRLYPFHLDYFSEKLSALSLDQHQMGLYLFYDINDGHLINNLEKESNKKTDRGKNMKVQKLFMKLHIFNFHGILNSFIGNFS